MQIKEASQDMGKPWYRKRVTLDRSYEAELPLDLHSLGHLFGSLHIWFSLFRSFTCTQANLPRIGLTSLGTYLEARNCGPLPSSDHGRYFPRPPSTLGVLYHLSIHKVSLEPVFMVFVYLIYLTYLHQQLSHCSSLFLGHRPPPTTRSHAGPRISTTLLKAPQSLSDPSLSWVSCLPLRFSTYHLCTHHFFLSHCFPLIGCLSDSQHPLLKGYSQWRGAHCS
jgi:hypothetical protein